VTGAPCHRPFDWLRPLLLGATLGAALGADAAAQPAQGDRQPVSDEAAQDIAAFLARHDRLLEAGDLGALRELYADDFCSADLEDYSAEEMLQHWSTLRRKLPDLTLRSHLNRITRLGNYYSVCCCRILEAHEGGETVKDDLCQALILRSTPPHLEIVGIHEIDHDKLGWLDDAGIRYVPPALGFEVDYPEGYFAIPHQSRGAELDHVRFVQPDLHAELSISFLDPTLPLDLEQAIRCDLGEIDGYRRTWVKEPAAAEIAEFDAFQATARYEAVAGAGGRFCDCLTSCLYLSPDGRLLFALRLRAPAATFERCREALWKTASTLRLRTGVRYPESLFDADPQLGRLDSRTYHPGDAPFSLDVPDALDPVPLAGRAIHRLRMSCRQRPSTQIVVLAFPPEFTRSAEGMLALSERRLEEQHRDAGLVLRRRTVIPREVLSSAATQVSLEFESAGTPRVFSVVAFDLDDHHVQVRLFPADGAVEADEQLLAEVLRGFRRP
jgi:hypothetical protein